MKPQTCCSSLRVFLAVLRELMLETRQDRPNEGILQKASDDLPCARIGVVEGSGDVGDRSDLLALPVLENLGHTAHDDLVELLKDVLVPVLGRIVDLDVLEERLDPAIYPAMGHLDGRVEREDSFADIELPIGSKEIVH